MLKTPLSTPLAAAAHHEAGHAAMCRLMHLRIASIAVGLDESGGGEIAHENPFRGARFPPGARPMTQRQMEKAVMLCLAGPMAQRKYLSGATRGEDGGTFDLDTALQVAMRFFRSKKTAVAYLGFARAWIEQKFEEPMIWAAVERLASALMVQRKLSGRQAEAILRGRSAAPRGRSAA